MQVSRLLEDAAVGAGQSGQMLEAYSLLAPLLSGSLLPAALSCLSCSL